MKPQTHRLLQVNGIRIHAVEQGEGPLVILVHGFPESWYSWRQQIGPLAEAGYRVVAIDMRGYGRSSKFRENKAFLLRKLAADIVGVAQAYGKEPAVVIGHDWGAPVAWTAAWLHPKVFRGVMGLSVPFAGRAQVGVPGNPFGEHRPDDYHKVIAGSDKTFYQDYFGAQDAILDEIEADLRGWLKGLIYTVSGDVVSRFPPPPDMTPLEVMRAGPLCIANGAHMKDAFVMPEVMPEWMTQADFDFYVNEFERSGFSGPLAFYHNIDNNWHDLADMDGKPLTVPACFVGGQYDVGTIWGEEAMARATEFMPNYLGSHIVPGAGHWIQQERPKETNRHILDFLRQLR